MRGAVLHNVTIYVEQSRFEAVRRFYRTLAGAPAVWEEPGHIACFGSAELAVCVHEAEPGHEAGTRELFFWVDDVDAVQAEAHRTGIELQRVGDELRCVDPQGTLIASTAGGHPDAPSRRARPRVRRSTRV